MIQAVLFLGSLPLTPVILAGSAIVALLASCRAWPSLSGTGPARSTAPS